MNRVRIYGKIVNTWKAWEPIIIRGQYQEREVVQQYELEYSEYDENGELVAVGTEDFSRERYREIDQRWVWIWDGKSFNRGGHRAFECMGAVKFNLNNQRAVFQYLRNKYGNASIVQMRIF